MTRRVPLSVRTSGDGPAVIFLHGLYGSGSNWRAVSRPLEGDYRVLLPDLRNHGQSPHAADMDYRVMADDVVALMDAEGIDAGRLVGHSMGGKVAMALTLGHPQRVHSALVVDIAPVAYDHSAEHGRLIAAMQALDTQGLRNREEADAQLAAAVPHPMVRQFLLTNLQRQQGAWGWRIPLAILADQLSVIQDWPLREPAPRSTPMVFLHGGASDYVDRRGRAAINHQFPQATIESIDGVGHWVHAEAPTAFGERLERFLHSRTST